MRRRKAGIIRRTVALFRVVTSVAKALPQLSSVDNRGGWWPIIRESFAGAWQQNVEVDTTTVLSFSALYSCITLIAGDVAKMRIKLMERVDEFWKEIDSSAFSPVLRKPNHYQTWFQFIENWIASLLIHGNTYVLKRRDNRGVVVGMYVLDPTRCRPLVAANGDVYYELKVDALAGLAQSPDGMQTVVPAMEIIHDRVCPLFHPLVGVSPIRACGLAALQGLRIQENSTLFFQNRSMPGGVLTAPGFINQETADRLKAYWETEFSGENIGKVAILGDGLKYEGMAVNAQDAQLIEQLKWTAENVCTAFQVPPYKVNVGPPPNHNNVEALDQQYYSQCIQKRVEAIESLLDEGLGLAKDGQPQQKAVEFEIDDLMRMDTTSRVIAAKESIAGGMSPNEARKRFHKLPPVKGGNAPYLQQQNFSLEALAKRDAKDDPFAKAGESSAAQPQLQQPRVDDDEKSSTEAELLFKSFDHALTKKAA